MYIILLGPPGAGKGTQAVHLAQKLDLVHIATGGLFRQAIEQQTELGKEVKSYTEKGALVPDEITIQMVMERLSASDCAGGVVFDGFPRNLQQAKALDEALAKQNKAIGGVIYIRVSEKELIKRLSGRRICRRCQTPYHVIEFPPKIEGKCDQCGGELYQRPDDREDIVKKRLKVYFTETTPLIDYYTKAGTLIEVDGEGEVEEVGRRILVALEKESVVR